jgi:hypothetical protein
VIPRRAQLVAFALLTAVLTVACKAKPPKPGTTCTKEGQSTCLDKTSRIHCTNGKNVLERCVSCEQTKHGGLLSSSEMSTFAGCVAGGIGPEGAACDGQTSDCDGRTLVQCVDHKFHRVPCGGTGGCTHQLDGVSCDSTIASLGEACREGRFACAADKLSQLTCQNGAFVLQKTCRGPKGCSVEPPTTKGTLTLDCDSSVGVIGEACVDGGACSTDKTSILKCVNGKYATYKRCRGTVAECKLDGKQLVCAEAGIGQAGDPCESGAACSADGKSFLECKSGAYALSHACRTCKTTGDRVNCQF